MISPLLYRDEKLFFPRSSDFFVFLLGVMMALIQVELLSFAFAKLGLSPELGLMLLFLSLLGSVINLPVTRIKSQVPIREFTQPAFFGLLRVPVRPFHNETQISINLGGCLIPAALSLYLFSNSPLSLFSTLLGIALITMISYFFSRPIQGLA